MQVEKNDSEVIGRAIERWRESGLVDDDLADRLRASVTVAAFDWQRLAKYSIWVAVGCGLVALVAALTDRYLRDMFALLFNAPYAAQSAGAAVLAAVFFWLAIANSRNHPERRFGNDAIMFAGVLAMAGAVYLLGRALAFEAAQISRLVLASYAVYAAIGYVSGSKLCWLFSLLSLGGWLGAETGYVSGWGAYYLGMNYPLRFAVFGAALTLIALVPWHLARFETLRATTLAVGLSYFFISLWILSILGNRSEFDWFAASFQNDLFGWSLLFAVSAGLCVWYGLRNGNDAMRGFGLTFLFINGYTRYFEFFWDTTHKALFFAILAVSFWFLGRKAERIWNRDKKQNTATAASV